MTRNMNDSAKLIEKIFEISPSIRYVSVYKDDILESKQKENIDNCSSSESDKYEELFVNPTILKIASQRGKVDCGGLEYVIIKYGNFYQLIRNYQNGHVSICIDVKQNPFELQSAISEVLCLF